MRTAPSWRPPPAPPRAKVLRRGELPFRAGEGPRRLHPVRADARRYGASTVDRFARELDVSDSEIAEAFKNLADCFGAEVRSGAAVVTGGEIVKLLPHKLACAVLCEWLHDVIITKLACDDISADDALRHKLALTNIHALRVLLVA